MIENWHMAWLTDWFLGWLVVLLASLVKNLQNADAVSFRSRSRFEGKHLCRSVHW